jgi:purine-binding chemotaxis protein CheW
MNETEELQTTQYLSFKLEEEVYALDIGRVREVLDFTSATTIPKTPDYLRGIINIRGSVVPVVDLRLKFGMTETVNTVDTCIIIVETMYDDEHILIGALADSVKEVFELSSDQIEPPPRIGIKLDVDFIKGMGKHEDGFIIILDCDNVFSKGEVAAVSQAATSLKTD